MYYFHVIKNVVFKYLVYFINLTKNENRVYKLASEAFHRKLLAISTHDKAVIQKRLTSFLELINNSLILNSSLKRFGSSNDGGYLLYPKIDSEVSVISCGIGDNASFDFEISKKVKNVFMFDHTVNEPTDLKSNMFFFKLGVDDKTSKTHISLKDIIAKNQITKSILKLDIEGMEWKIIDELDIDLLLIFDQVIVEFHNLFDIALEDKSKLYFRVLNKLSLHYKILNIHPNNWSEFRILCGVPFVDTLELTLINKNFKMEESSTVSDQNMPNNPLVPEFILYKTN